MVAGGHGSRAAISNSSIAIPLVVLLLFGCTSSTDNDPYTVTILSGDQQPAVVGLELSNPLVVRVTRGGVPVAANTVRWRVIQGGASVSESTTQTDADGVATVRVTMPIDLTQVLVLAESNQSSVTFRFSAAPGFIAVGAGYSHSCALTSVGRAYCWGRNDRAQLGDASETTRPLPVRVSGGLQYSALAVGWFHTCGLTPGGALFCWGDNAHGQAGVGDHLFKHVPTEVRSNERFAAIAAGYLHTCALTLLGEAYCWGSNAQRALGSPGRATDTCANGDTICSLVPVRVETSVRFRSIAAGEFHTCAIAQDQAAYCWGWNSTGELGTTTTALGDYAAVPQRVAGNLTFTEISAHARHTCALATDQRVYCWGRNASGETGQDNFFNTPTPLPVPSATFTSVSTGNVYSCGVTLTRSVACWGSQANEPGNHKTPINLPAPADFSAVALGFAHACGISSFQVWCWGDNSRNQLGLVTPSTQVPQHVVITL